MPLVDSAYRAPWWLRNGHLATIIPSAFRKIPVTYERERISTPDNDFLDLDWRTARGNEQVVIVLHGLEGHSYRHYVAGMVNYFAGQGWDAVAFNSRSCSGTMNRQPRLYSHADAPDLAVAVAHVVQKGYKQIALVGFSMGGAIILNYLSKLTEQVPAAVMAAAALSAPVDVGASARALARRQNSFYRRRFLKKMIARVKRKAAQFPGLLDTTDIDKITTFDEYDRRFTAPLQGYHTPAEFYKDASSLHHLSNILVPTLLLIAHNDPFMPPACYPYEQAQASESLFLETPQHGGHVGFTATRLADSWAEERVFAFVNAHS